MRSGWHVVNLELRIEMLGQFKHAKALSDCAGSREGFTELCDIWSSDAFTRPKLWNFA